MPEQLYDRTSGVCAVEALDPRLLASLLARAERDSLGDVAGKATASVQTRSVPRRRPGRFSLGRAAGPHETLTAAVLLPLHLLVVVADLETERVVAQSGRLDDMTVEQDLPQLTIDTGVSVFTRWSNGTEAASLHVALGDDPAGNAFKEQLREAVRDANS
ncbi:MAG TPA: hypothetical protein VGX23_10490 [Actinocrinis sp.]|nr:hypothetical protein [Actinocrinis sp.]